MRTHYCGELNSKHIGDTVTVCGWVHRRRDHGGVIFLDLRDRQGLLQVVVDPDTEQAFATADRARSEWVMQVTGLVRTRPEGTVNADMSTGEIEVLGREVNVLNTADTPPFQLDEHSKVGEEVRLKHRYMDLRRPEMLENLMLRSRVTTFVRQFVRFPARAGQSADPRRGLRRHLRRPPPRALTGTLDQGREYSRL